MQTYSFTTQEILDTLSEGGVKPSAQRIAILRYLMENRIHPTVDEIFKSLQPTNPTLAHHRLQHLAPTCRSLHNPLHRDWRRRRSEMGLFTARPRTFPVRVMRKGHGHRLQ